LDEYRVWYWISSLILSIILFKPVKKFIFVQRVRKTERRLKRDLTDEEREDIGRRCIPATALVVVTFSFLFNATLMGKYFK